MNNKPDKVLIFDTTLRDGEQSPGASMTRDEKLRIARQLERLKVDVIEAGFAASSNGDFECVKAIAEAVKDSTVCSLARANDRDIARAAEALKPAKSGRLHLFLATSALHMEKKLRMTPDEVYEQAKLSVRFARNLMGDIEFSPEDGYRSDPDFLCRVLETVIKEGATTINVPDTVGYAIPELYGIFIKNLRERIPNSDKAVWSVHCHNDLGMAVANSLAGVMIGGARQVECTINGLGERAGNTALEEVVMALRVRNDIMPYQTGIDTTKIMKASRLVSTVSGFPVQFNKAIVGKNAFLHESGIHQDGVLKNAETFEIMRPADIGITDTNLVMGKHSGRAALRSKLGDLGHELADNQLNDVFVRFKALADRKKEIYDDDLIALMQDTSTNAMNDYMQIKRLRVVCGTDGPQTADLTMTIGGVDHSVHAVGDGPVDASFKAVKMLFPHQARLQLYQVHAVTEGTDAQATVSVRMEEDGKIVTGQSADTDTVVASAKAYVNALNKLILRRQRSAPDAKQVHYKDASA